MSSHSFSSPSPEQPRENLQLRWTRQCSALLAHQEELLQIGNDLVGFAEAMRGQPITAKHGEATAQFEDLQQMKEEAIAGLDEAVRALQAIETEAGVSLRGERTRFESVRDRLREIDLSQIPSDVAFEPDFQHHVHNFVSMQDNTPEGRDLQQTFEDEGISRLRPAMRTHAKELTKAAEQVRILSALFTAAREQVRTKRNVQLKGKIGGMRSVYEKAVQADRFTGVREENVDVADPLRTLRREIEVFEKGNRDFVTASEYAHIIGRVCNEAYGLVDTLGYRDHVARESAPRAEPGVTAQQTESAGGTTRRRHWLADLFRRP